MFDFHLIRQLPRPRLSFLFLVIFFTGFCIWHVHPQPDITAADIKGSLENFLSIEQGESPKHPRILIAGASLGGFGFHTEELEKMTGASAAKITLGKGTPKDMLDVFECFANETSTTKMLFLELAPQRLTQEQPNHRKAFFDQFRSNNRNSSSLITKLLRYRHSLNYIVKGAEGGAGLLQDAARWDRDNFDPIADLHRQKDYWEKLWHSRAYEKAHRKSNPELHKTAELARVNRDNSPLMLYGANRSGQLIYRTEQIESVHSL
ncbi:MAG: hypothetical protein LBT89_03625, partial [Planctomycetaceae bacterium]|nr:hypothetical protein [Planctomycetaceae bacterium]